MAEQKHYRACNLCEAICGLEFTLDDGEITRIQGDKADPFSQGHICPKGVALQDLQNDPDRLRQPVKRTADGWEEIEWDEAYELAATALAKTIQTHGDNAVGAYFGNPNVHNYGSMTHSSATLGLIKTRNRFSATSVDQLPHQLLSYKSLGHQLLVPIPDIDRTGFFLILGGNPMASNGSIMTVPNFPGRVKALQKRGGKLVVIDPRHSETAKVADAHHFIRPGTDAALLLAMLNIIFAENLNQSSHLDDIVDGLDHVKDAVAPFTPERAADITGIAADTIRQLARDFAAADKAVCYGRMGVSVQQFGGLCQWVIQVINIVTNNFDAEGGMMLPEPAVSMTEGPTSKPGHFNAWQSRISGLPEFAGELPASALAEEILTPPRNADETNIRALFTAAGNPVLSTPNGRQLEKALEQLDFMVSVDFYINETTRFADVILPPTSPLEHDHYDMIFNAFAVRNVTRFNEPLLPKPAGSKHDWEIYNELGETLAEKLGKSPRKLPPPSQLMDMGLQMGQYSAARKHPAALSLKTLKDNPHGIDLGPLQPNIRHRLQTDNKRINLADEFYLNDLQRVENELFSAAEDDQIRLIGRRHVRSNNSWLHNSQRLVKGKPRHQLLMNPADMHSRALTTGDTVTLRSSIGELRVAVEASDDMMPGVVSLPHGWGHTRQGIRQTIASEHAGVSCNDIIPSDYFDALSGNAAVNGVPVEVERAA